MSATPIIAAIQHSIQGPVVQVVRPSNTTAYAAGQVWGDSVDARVALAVPAAPAGMVVGASLSLQVVLGRAQSETIANFVMAFFASLPSTVLKDQDAFSLSDPDIALILQGSSNFSPQQLGAETLGNLGPTVGASGRRVIGSGNVNLQTGAFFTPGTTIYCYIRTIGAYTPVALETMWLTPLWAYSLASSV